MRIDYHRLPYAIVIGGSLTFIISFLSFVMYNIWLDSPVAAILIVVLLPLCVAGAYRYLGKL